MMSPAEAIHAYAPMSREKPCTDLIWEEQEIVAHASSDMPGGRRFQMDSYIIISPRRS
jgi:hypothetical protein